MKQNDKKMFYVFVCCITLSVVIIGGTFAYFTASSSDNTTVDGNAATVSFGLKVDKVTDIDNAFGLIPMKNDQAPGAAYMKCKDDNNNAGCQIYKITVSADSDTVMFLDGYIVTTPKEGVETRISSVYYDPDDDKFSTRFSTDDFLDSDTLKDDYFANKALDDQGIRTGACEVSDSMTFNHDDSSDCLIVLNQKIGGDVGRERVFYIMIWVYDDGMAQDYLQGMELAYHGMVVFVTAQGNEITATFD